MARMGEGRRLHRFLVGKPVGKRPLGRPRRRYDMIYLLTTIGLSPGGSSTVHIYTQTIHRTIQNKQYIEQRWEDNIKMDLQEVGGGCGDWMELAQDRDSWWALVSTVRNLRVPKMRGIS